MSTSLTALFQEFDLAAKAAHEQDNKWLIIDKVYEHLKDLQAAPFDELLPHILQLIEIYPNLDYGGPGPFGSLIEDHPMASYTPALADSLLRQPSTQVIGWLDRTMRVDDDMRQRNPNPVDEARFAAVLETVLQHPHASDDCKAFAQMCLADLN